MRGERIRTPVVTIAAVAAIGFLAAGCGSSEPKPKTSATSTASTQGAPRVVATCKAYRLEEWRNKITSMSIPKLAADLGVSQEAIEQSVSGEAICDRDVYEFGRVEVNDGKPGYGNMCLAVVVNNADDPNRPREMNMHIDALCVPVPLS
jgi:hypothetical protein